jgi:AraC-like DNA-binding protein
MTSAAIVRPARGVAGEQLHALLSSIGARVPDDVLQMGYADSVEAWAESLGIADRTLSRRFRDAGYAPPSKYVVLRRLIGALLDMEAGANAATSAIRNGYSTPHDFSNQCMHNVGARPRDAVGDVWRARAREILGVAEVVETAPPATAAPAPVPPAEPTEYEKARDRAIARHAAERLATKIELRARRLLNVAGWCATAEQMRAAAAGLPETERIDDDLLEPAITCALELMNDETVVGRRVRPEEATMPRKIMSDEVRAKVERFVRDRKAQSPNISAKKVHAEVCDTFELSMSMPSFYTLLWSPISKQATTNGNGKHAPAKNVAASAPKERATRADAAPVKTAAPATPPPSAPIAPASSTHLPVAVEPRSTSEAPYIVGPPVLQVLPLSDGRMRIQIDTEFQLEGALTLLAAVIADRRQQSDAAA